MRLPKFIKLFASVFIISSIFIWAYGSLSNPKADEKPTLGKKIFKKNCSGCHAGGKNVIEPEKPIIGSLKLKKKDTFKLFIQDPPKPMPKFNNIASDDEKLEALHKYVSSLKEK